MLLRGGARGPAGRAGSGSGCERRPVNRSHTAYNATRLLHFWGMQDALPGRTVAGVMGHGWVSTTRWCFHPGCPSGATSPGKCCTVTPATAPSFAVSATVNTRRARRICEAASGRRAVPRGRVSSDQGRSPYWELALSAPTSEPPCIAVVVAPSPHYSPLSSASWSTKRDSLINESSVAAENVSAIWRAADFFLPADCASCAAFTPLCPPRRVSRRRHRRGG